MSDLESYRRFQTAFAGKNRSNIGIQMEEFAYAYMNQPAVTDRLTETSDASLEVAGTNGRFDWKNYYPIEFKQPLKAFLTAFFPHRFDSIRREITANGEWRHRNTKNAKKPGWWTSKWRLSDTEIIKAFAGVAPYLYGCKFGEQSRFAVLDIDAGSEYHNLNSVNEIRSTLREAGLKKATAYQSSDSTGWHLYIFFSNRIGSIELHDTLKLLLQNNGFNIERGTLEIFPNPGKATGFGLRLPLQQGFAWLNQETLKVSDYSQDLSAWERCERFIADTTDCNPSHSFLQARKNVMATKGQLKDQNSNNQTKASSKTPHITLPKQGVRSQYNKISVEMLNKVKDTEVLPSSWNQASPVELKAKASNYDLSITFAETIRDTDAQIELVRTIFNGTRPTGLEIDRWLQGRELWISGLTHSGQRSHALYCVNHYCFFGDPTRDFNALGYGCESQRTELVKYWLSQKHNGFSKQINDGDADAYDQIERMNNGQTKVSETHSEEMLDQSLQGGYQGSGWQGANDLRSKIASEKIMAAASTLQSEPSAYELAKLSGCAIQTVKKHRVIWMTLFEPVDPNSIVQSTSLEEVSEDIIQRENTVQESESIDCLLQTSVSIAEGMASAN